MPLTVAQLVARLTADTSGFYRGMAVANSAMLRSGGLITRVAAGAGLAVGAMGLLSLRSAGNFQQSMNILQAVSGATTDRMGDLRHEAIALGADFKLPSVSAKDAADAMVELSKGGLSARRVLDATRGTLQLGLAANVGFADSAKFVANALQAFQMPGTQAGRVANLLAAAANKSTAEITDLAYGMQAAGAQFHGARMPIEDMTASLALLANRGLSGEYAGTALKTMLVRLTGPTDKAAAVMKNYGIEIFNANGTMKSMPAVIQEFQDGIGGLTDQQREQALITIFGVRANQAMRILMEDGAKSYTKFRDSITGTNAAQRMAEARTRGFNGALQAFGSAAETLAIQLGTALLPAATQVVRAMSRFIANVNPDKIIAFGGAIKDLVAALFGFVAAHESVQFAIAAIVGAFVGFQVISMVIGLVRALQAAWIALNATFLLSPIGLILIALAALVGALVLAYMKSEQFRAIVDGVFSWLRDNIPAYVNAVKDAVLRAWNAIASNQTLRTVLTDIRTIWNNIRAITMAVWNAISSFLRAHWSTISAVATAAFNVIRSVVTNAWNVIWAITSSIWKIIAAVVVNALGVISGRISAMTALRNIVAAVWNGIKAVTQAAWNAIKNTVRVQVTQIPRIILGVVGLAVSAAAAIGHGIVSGILSGIGGLASSLAGALKGAVGSAIGSVKGMLHIGSPSKVTEDEIGKPIAQGIIRGFLLGIADLPTKMNEKLRVALESAKNTVDSYRGILSDSFSQLGQDALAAFDKATRTSLTPSEALIKHEEDARASAQLQRNIQEAQEALAEAMAGDDPQAVLDAQRRLDDALWDQRKASLTALAEQERLDYEAKREMRRRQFEDQLTQLETNLSKHPERWRFYQNQILALLRKNGITYQSIGATLGHAYAQGLRDSVGDIRSAAQHIAHVIAQYLKLGSPAEKGPLSDLNEWWSPFARTLVSGLDTSPVTRAAAGLAGSVGNSMGVGSSFASSGLAAAGVGSAVLENHVHVTLDGKELWTSVQRRGIEHKRLNGSTGL